MTVTPVVHPKPQVLYIDGAPMAQTKAVLRRDSVGTAGRTRQTWRFHVGYHGKTL